jgi:hypothetical protein
MAVMRSCSKNYETVWRLLGAAFSSCGGNWCAVVGSELEAFGSFGGELRTFCLYQQKERDWEVRQEKSFNNLQREVNCARCLRNKNLSCFGGRELVEIVKLQNLGVGGQGTGEV